MGISFRDKGLRQAFKSLENSNKIEQADVNKLLKAAMDGPGLSKTEAKDLKNWLLKAADRMEPSAKSQFEHPAAAPNGVSRASTNAGRKRKA